MKPGKIETDLLEHSKAKVQLYSKYLSVYLNILSRVKSVKSIYLFDLLCGEGLYSNNEKGSPLECLDVVLKHCGSSTEKGPIINILLNDNGESKIVPGKKKIQRLKEIVDGYDFPDNVHIEFHDSDFEAILSKSYKKAEMANQSKSLFFIDPYGYKEIKPDQIRTILSLKNTELLLFLPASFMYRFSNRCLEEDFCGSEPLYAFLTGLFQSTDIRFDSIDDFIRKCKNQFVDYLTEYQIFVDSFSIQRNRTNTYALFFFTSNLLGFEKMLEAKWEMDEEKGQGFRLDNQRSLFSGIDHSDYSKQIERLLSENKIVTNGQLYVFGLKNGYLPKHTKQVLDRIRAQNFDFELISLDGENAKGYYINYKNYGSNPDRKIGVRIKQP